MTQQPQTEFDAHAEEYDAGVANGLKTLVGDSAVGFVAMYVGYCAVGRAC
jgi:hypothetical protein